MHQQHDMLGTGGGTSNNSRSVGQRRIDHSSKNNNISEESFGNGGATYSNLAAGKDFDGVSFTNNQLGGFITELPLHATQSLGPYHKDSAGSQHSTRLPSSSNAVRSGSTGRLTSNQIRFIMQRNPMAHNTSRASSLTPFFSRSKFGERINDHVRLLRESWDRHLEDFSANKSGSASKLLYGASCLKENNYIRFDKQTSREYCAREALPKAHPARFIHMPESGFSDSFKKKGYITLGK